MAFFHVVEFGTGQDLSMSVIPDSWLLVSQEPESGPDQCYWPKGPASNTWILNGPDRSWPVHDITVKFSTSQYSKALEKCKQLEQFIDLEASSLSEGNPAPTRKKRRRQSSNRWDQESNSLSESEDESPPPPSPPPLPSPPSPPSLQPPPSPAYRTFPTSPARRTPLPSCSASPSTPPGRHFHTPAGPRQRPYPSLPSLSRRHPRSTQCSRSMHSDVCDDRIEVLIDSVSEMRQRLDSIDAKLDWLLVEQDRRREEAEPAQLPEGFTFPLESHEKAEKLEQHFVDNPDSKKNMIRYLITVGGENVRALTKNILAKLYANSLARITNFDGNRPPKKGFARLINLMEVIEEVVRKQFPGSTNEVIKKEVRWWLGGASDREGGKQQ